MRYVNRGKFPKFWTDSIVTDKILCVCFASIHNYSLAPVSYRPYAINPNDHTSATHNHRYIYGRKLARKHTWLSLAEYDALTSAWRQRFVTESASSWLEPLYAVLWRKQPNRQRLRERLWGPLGVRKNILPLRIFGGNCRGHDIVVSQ